MGKVGLKISIENPGFGQLRMRKAISAYSPLSRMFESRRSQNISNLEATRELSGRYFQDSTISRDAGKFAGISVI